MIRAARADDAPAIAAIYAHYVAGGTISFEDEAPDAAAMLGRMTASDCRYPWLAAEEQGVLAGYAYASEWSARSAYRWTVETTIYLAANTRGRGIGRRLYAALLATLTAQGFGQAIGRISLPNDPSVALHAALGFRQSGTVHAAGWKAGRWIDVEQWQRPLADPGNPPAEPLPFATVGVRA